MASRFDTIPQFNPYIQEIPMDLAAQVGYTKQQSYNQGVQAVQSTVDKIAGMDVIKAEDKQLLQQKLSQLSGNISKLAGEDFSNPLVVGRASNLTASIYKDPGIQNAILGTQLYRTKKASLEEMRTKKPELYNANNELYSMIDINNWLSDKQAGTPLVDTHSYSDYYDYAKEVREAMKDFHPAEMKKAIPNGEWIITSEDKSWTNAELKRYLNGVLSDRAKQQMKIESVVSFWGNNDLLLDSYKGSLLDDKSTNAKRLKELSVQSTIEKDQEKRQLITGEITSLQNHNAEIDDHIGKINTGDTNYFNAHKEAIAASLFKDAYINQVAAGYQHPDTSITYAPNAIWQSRFTQSMENARMNERMRFEAAQKEIDREQQKDLKAWELGLKYYNNGKLVDAGQQMLKAQPNISEKDKIVSGKQEFDKQYASLNDATNANYNLLRKKLLASHPDLKQQYLDFVARGGKDFDSNNPADIAARQYILSESRKPASQRDRWMNDLIEEHNRISMSKAVLDNQRQEITDVVALNYGSDIIASKKLIDQFSSITLPEINEISTITRGGKMHKGYQITGKQTITASDFLNFMLNTDSGNSKQQVIRSVIGSMYDVNAPELNAAKDALSAYQKHLVTSLGGPAKVERLKNALSFEAGLYNKAALNLGDWWTPVADKDPRVKTAINYIQRQGGGDPKEYNVSFANKTTGEIQFRLTPEKNTTINTGVLESLGYTYNKANDTYSTTQLSGLFARDMTGLSTTEKVLASALEGNTNIPQVGYYTPAHHWDPNGNGQFIQIIKDLGPDGNFRYYLRHENSGSIIDMKDFTDPISAISAAKELTADLKMLQDVIRKKDPHYTIK